MEKFGLKQVGENSFEGRRLAFIDEVKAGVKEDGYFYLSAYVNTKNKPDSYGDIPYNLNGAPVYDLTRIKKNPVMLADHCVSVGHIMGEWVELEEDLIGLRAVARLIKLEDAYMPEIKHAIACYQSGFARAFSIAGIWEFNDPNNKSHLTTAKIFEISGVAVGADEDALVRNLNTVGKSPKSSEVQDRSALELQFLKAKANVRSTKNVGISVIR